MNRPNAARWIFVLVLTLNAVGMMTIYSSSAPVAARQINYRNKAWAKQHGETFTPINHHPKYLYRQLVWFAISMAGLMFLYRKDYNKVLQRAKYFWLFSMGLLAVVLIAGREVNGARRWLFLGPFTIQPSEFAKLGLVILTAKVLNDRHKELHSFTQGFLQPLLLAGLTVSAIMIEDFGSAAVLALIVCIMWYIGEVRLRHLISLIPLGVGVLVLGVLMKSYRIGRVCSWILGGDALGRGWHAKQALIAVGSGGLDGLGLGNGIQKYKFVAAMYTDFIYADIGEELGFIGAVALLLLFAALFIIGFSVAYRTPDFVGGLLAAGLTTMIAVPVVVNVAVVLSLLPTKGLPLPFISYGGSSLFVNMCAIGILMNIAERNAELNGVKQRVAVTQARRVRRRG